MLHRHCGFGFQQFWIWFCGFWRILLRSCGFCYTPMPPSSWVSWGLCKWYMGSKSLYALCVRVEFILGGGVSLMTWYWGDWKHFFLQVRLLNLFSEWCTDSIASSAVMKSSLANVTKQVFRGVHPCKTRLCLVSIQGLHTSRVTSTINKLTSSEYFVTLKFIDTKQLYYLAVLSLEQPLKNTKSSISTSKKYDDHPYHLNIRSTPQAVVWYRQLVWQFCPLQ